jgi:hypothetical protein
MPGIGIGIGISLVFGAGGVPGFLLAGQLWFDRADCSGMIGCFW